MGKIPKTYWKLIAFPTFFFASTGLLHANEPPLIIEAPFQDVPEVQEHITDLPELSTPNDSISTESSNLINDIEIQGGTVFSLEQLSVWIQPIIGKPAKRELLVEMINDITTAYAEAGYPLSYASIPSGQDVSSGKITLRLIEGYLARSEVEVDGEHIEKRIARYVDQMMQERPLTQETFERYAALIESTPGYKFRINVPRPMSASGATTIRVEQVKKEFIKPGLAIDKSESDSSRVLGSVSLNSMTSYGDQLTLSGILPNDEIDEFYSANYSQFINDDGLKIALSASHYESDNGDRFFVADVPIDYEENKVRDEYTAGLYYPLQLGQALSWWIGSNINHVDEQSLFELHTSNASSQINKDLTYSAVEAFTSLQFNTEKSVSRAKFAVKKGVDLGGNQNQLKVSTSTTSGAEDLHFTYLTTELFWRSRLTVNWQIQTRIHGQWSDDILPSAEQARYGNVLYARGYPEGQAQGDRGYAGEVKLRYIQPIDTTFIKQVEPYVIFDGARSHLISSDSSSTLSSASLGVAFTDNRYYGLSMEYSIPTGDSPIDSDSRSGIFNLRVRWQL